MRLLTVPIIGVVIAIAVLAEVFLAWPEIDLAVSGLVFLPSEGRFLVQDTPLGEFVDRDLRNLTVLVFAVIVIGAIGAWAGRGHFAGATVRGYLFVLISVGLSVGLLVNVAFKENSGRARPKYVAEFAGDKAFTPAFVPANQCRQNCSFVSGDASVGFSTLAVALLASRRRRAWIVTALTFGALMSTMRILQGKHFLSDVTFGGLFTVLTVLVLYQVMIADREPPAHRSPG